MHKNSKNLMILFAVAVLVSLTVGIVSAATVTNSITYQGKLTNAAGSPLTGPYTVTFKLYDVSSGGTALATDTHSVTATKGLFTTQITADPRFFDGRALWLGIKVGADAEMTPRQEIRPVPYALSLRPGAVITGTDVSSTLNLQNNGGGTALDASTSGTYSPGVLTKTSGDSSHGVRAYTSGTGSHAVYATTWAPGSIGVWAYTEGIGSPGVYASTDGRTSAGVRATTYGMNSHGVDVLTTRAGSNGVNVTTSGGGYGVEVTTSGSNSPAFVAHTSSTQSDGLYAETNGWGSWGVDARTAGDSSHGVSGSTTGPNSWGVRAISSQSYGLYADTARADQKYGIYTPDYLYAKGTQVPAADIAEYMPVTQEVSPGTVLVIGPEGKLQPSQSAYDTRVIGIVSTDPGVTLGTREDGNPGEALIAVAGRVPCKVDAGNGAIRPGDLLHTSDTPGYAMKAMPVNIGGIEIYKPSRRFLAKQWALSKAVPEQSKYW